MQTVSDQFKAAILNPERRIKAKVTIDLFNSPDTSLPTGTVTSSGSFAPTGYASSFPATAAFDKNVQVDPVLATQALTVFATTPPTGSMTFTPGTLGWWASGTTNGSGVVATQTLTMDYGNGVPINGFSVYGDPILGYPVDFVVSTSDNQSTWTPRFTVAGNTQVVWGRALPLQITSRYIRLEITRFSRNNAHPVVVEFSTTWTISTSDALADKINAIEITREAFYEDSTNLPIGNFSASSCHIEIDNTDGLFYQRNKNSPYFGYLRANKKVKIWFGLYVPTDVNADSQGYVWLPIGTYYTRSFGGGLQKGTTTLEAWDRAKILNEAQYDGSIVYEGQTIHQLMVLLLNFAGIPLSQQNIAPTNDILDFAFFEPGPYWKHLTELAVAESGFLSVDENNSVTLKDRHFYWSSRLDQPGFVGQNTIHVRYIGPLDVGLPLYISDGINNDPYTVSAINYDSGDPQRGNESASGNVVLTTTLIRNYNADAYTSISLPVVILDETNALTDLDDVYTIERLKNRVEIKTNPLVATVDPKTGIPIGEEVVFKRDNNDPLRIDANSSVTLKIDFQHKPVLSNIPAHPVTISSLVYDSNSPPYVPPTPGIYLDPPYISYQWVDKNNIGTPFGPYAWGGYLVITNHDLTQARIFDQIVISGWTLSRVGGLVFSAKDDILINQYGEKVFSLDSPYVIRSVHGQSLATHLMASWRDPTAPLKISLPKRGLFHLQLGDRVQVLSSSEGLTTTDNNSHFYIVRYHMKFDGTLDEEIDCIAAN